MFFTIYADLAEEVEKKLSRLSKKAQTYGITFSYEIGEEHPQEVRVMGVDHATSTTYEVSRHTVAAVDVTVDCEGLIKANGWTVCAKIEHGENGNIVTGFGDHPVNREWYTVAPNCDHCHVNRFRSVTFMCVNEKGEYKQVGKTCLKDYTGINPATAALWAEVQSMMDKGMDCTTEEWEGGRPTQMYDVLCVLGHASDMIAEFGYRKSDERASTKEKVTGLVLEGKKPTELGMKEAVKLRDWLIDLAPEAAGDLEMNCKPLALSGFAKAAHFGRLAYIPVAFKRYQERIEWEAQKEAARQEAIKSSNYVGEVGQRITFKAATATLLTSWEGVWGDTWLYKFTDEQGNVYIWYASRPIDESDGMTIKATVKDHKERDGVKQTVLTRCSVVCERKIEEIDPSTTVEAVFEQFWADLEA